VTPERILIVRLSSIGDVIHTLPAYEALRSTWPEAKLGWAVEEAAEDLVAALPDVRVHLLPIQTWRRRPALPSTWGAIRRARSELVAARYDLAIDFQGLLKSALVARAPGAQVLGMSRADAREQAAARFYHRRAAALPRPVHAVDRALHLAAAAGAQAGSGAYPAMQEPRAAERVRRHLRQMGIGDSYIVLHAGANWPSKRYPRDRLVAAAGELHRRTGHPVLWVWGPGEREEVAELARQAGAGNHAAFATTLTDLAALLADSRLFIGGDSAPLHLAVALGAPVVAIFGPTDPALLGPRASEDIVVHRVLECSHCHRRQCPLGTLECLESIPPEKLVAAALERLSRAS